MTNPDAKPDSPEPITEIVERFLALQDEGGAPYLEEFCSRYPESQRAEIRRRCEEAEDLGDLLAELERTPEDDKTIVDRDLYLNVPEQIGPYRILERVGRGGMGVVHRAEQSSPVRRHVAVKLILSDHSGKEDVIARFGAERQALAMMNHPNIAKVFDAGTTDANQPYFAMEFVPGVPITRFCDEHRLSIQERLRLHQQVCGAVQHAHQKGIIHRDLKPSNILVSQEADEPVCKVIDFGVARATEQRLTEESLHTLLVGTPAYMSPEQAEPGNLDIDVRADVYSLGVLLYELLTGELPLGGLDKISPTPAAIEEARRRIRDIEPMKPSSRFADANEAARAVAENRRAQPQDLSRELRGDLDWITLRALEKDRNRRYQSAADLSEDIQRHLEHEPVLAGPPSTAYRLSKFVRRYRVLVGASAAVFVALVAGLVSSLLFLDQARAAEEKAKESATLAERTLDELLQLSSIQIVNNLRQRADEDLWPPVSTKIPEMEDWIAEAEREVVPLLAPLNGQLERLKDEALPYTEEQARRDRETHSQAGALAEARAKAQDLEQQLTALLSGGSNTADKEEIESFKKALEAQQVEVARLEALVSERRTYEFEDGEKMTATQKGWRFELLRSLLTDLQAFVEGPGEPDEAVVGYAGEAYGPSLPEVLRRLDLARRLHERTVLADEADRLWAEAIADIRAHPEYRFELTVQEGLLPIGKDPNSGLWEFAVLSTGELPERDQRGRIIVSDDMAVVLVLIPGGEFDMGAETPEEAKRPEGSPNIDPQAQSDESPIRTIALDLFFLSKYEMTQGQWERACAARPSLYDMNSFPQEAWRRHPVEQVSWFDCNEVLPRLGLSLPTEAQWEYGTRARTTSVWWPGNEEEQLQGMENIADQSNRRGGGWQPPVPWDDGYEVHAPVGTFLSNRFGLHDVCGNVCEWCWDGFGDYELDPSPGDGLRHVEGSRFRSCRGGGFITTSKRARSANRGYDAPNSRDYLIGVRPARFITH